MIIHCKCRRFVKGNSRSFEDLAELLFSGKLVVKIHIEER